MVAGSRYGSEIREHVFNLRRNGYSLRECEKLTGVSCKTIHSWEVKARTGDVRGPLANGNIELQDKMPRPVYYDKMPDPVQEAYKSFPAFRVRYMNRRIVPWQTIAAKRVVKWLHSDHTEYIVMNLPPGAGKSTFWTDLMCWLIVRDRTIRILFGSRTVTLATQPVNRVRRMLTRTRPLPDAEGCIARDFGRFKPELSDIWRRNEFTVMAMDEAPVEDKEATVTAYGMESEFLGHRGDLVIWDDLVVGSTLRNLEQIQAQQKWWEEEGSTRVEPGGALVLNGQRMGPADLYRYSLDQKLGDTERSRFQHVIYPAHFDDLCTEQHGPNLIELPDGELGYEEGVDVPQPWPDGCLLDPIRIPWHGTNGLESIRRNRVDKYRVQYQQEEIDAETVLVQAIWVSGGRTKDGEEFPGCWDNHRGLCEVPHGLSAPVYSVATADPSPTKFWAVEWWIHHPASNQRFLMDILRQSMDAPDFLDWNENSKSFYGVMEDWQKRSQELCYPITHWIVENNAAQRFLLQYDHVQRWTRQNKVQLIAHSTGQNKLDPDYGIQMLANLYKFGNVRLPGRSKDPNGLPDMGRIASLNLINEATRYPSTGVTDDCLMAQWFLEFNLPRIARPPVARRQAPRPKWMRREKVPA